MFDICISHSHSEIAVFTPSALNRTTVSSRQSTHFKLTFLQIRTTKMPDGEQVRFSLKVLTNKEKTKVLFAEADSHFVDVLLSFLTLPLGRIVKVLEKHYGDEAPAIGSLSNLYHSLMHLDSSHFLTEGAKQTLLNPISSFDAECETLKLDISDPEPAEYFFCNRYSHNRFRSLSVYYDRIKECQYCKAYTMRKEVVEKGSVAAASDDGTLTKKTTAFIISDDLRISSYEAGLMQTCSKLGITDMDSTNLINVSFGFSEIMNLLKASFVSPTPLSDLILPGRMQMKSHAPKSKPEISQHKVGQEETSNSKKIILKVMVQKSTGKLLCAQAECDFVELLFSFLIIPLGGVEHLLAGNTCIKSIDNLYRSVADNIDSQYFKTPYSKDKLIKPKLPDGYISKNHVLPLREENLPFSYELSLFSSTKFPKGQGVYINGPITYHVADDLTVTPFSVAPVLSSLSELNIPMSDVRQVDVEIGSEEALSILKASLTSKFALSNGLESHISIKHPKPELLVVERQTKKQKQAAKDPNKPKMAASAFFVFMEDFRKKYKEKHPRNKYVAAVGKAGGAEWKSMSAEDKMPFVAIADQRKEEYERKMKAYNKKLAGEDENGSDKSESDVQDEERSRDDVSDDEEDDD